MHYFQVCDEPHPLAIKEMLSQCAVGNVDEAYKIVHRLFRMGYSCDDIIGNVFRIAKTHGRSQGGVSNWSTLRCVCVYL